MPVLPIPQNRHNSKRPKPILRKLLHAHRLLHGIRRAALDLRAEFAVQELDQVRGEALRAVCDRVEGYGGVGAVGGFG